MKTKTKIPQLILAGLFASVTALPSKGAITYITGVTIEDFDGERTSREAINAINGSGFTEASGFHVNVNGDGNSYMSDFTTSGTEFLPHYITFDLGVNYSLGSVKVWNYNDAANLSIGAKDVTISVASTDGASYPADFTDVWTGVFDQAPGLDNVDFGQVIDLNTNNVRLVRFDITTNYGFNETWADLSGLSEVRFTAVPEPSSTALLGLGFSALLLRRKRS